jgi:predicted signal transduction protein with EAL and GGDEF domain
MQPVEVRILHMAECPATPATVRLVEDVARSLDVPIVLETVLVETSDQAQTLQFLGSPTVQVAGRDIEPEAGDRQDFGLT